MLEITNNTVVKCHYSLREGGASGELIESTEGAAPLTYVQGVGNMIPPFEQNMLGKKAGDDFSFFIKSEDAYGNYDDRRPVSKTPPPTPDSTEQKQVRQPYRD